MLKLKKNLLQFKKVFALIGSMSKSFLWLTFFISLLQAITPFITIVGSSSLINGFTQKLPAVSLIGIAAIAISLNIVFVLLLGFLQKKLSLQHYCIDNKLEMLLSAKVLTMDYE